MSKSAPTYIGLCNPKSPSNVGSVLRAAGCYQVSQVYYSGERFDRASKYQTDTKNAGNSIPLKHAEDFLSDLANDMQIVCIELVEGAKALPDFTHPESAMYVFGPEDSSVPQDWVDRADHVVYIPTVGCMNLAATVNVVLYDRLAKSAVDIDHEAQIKQSRDSNNRLKIKASG